MIIAYPQVHTTYLCLMVDLVTVHGRIPSPLMSENRLTAGGEFGFSHSNFNIVHVLSHTSILILKWFNSIKMLKYIDEMFSSLLDS